MVGQNGAGTIFCNRGFHFLIVYNESIVCDGFMQRKASEVTNVFGNDLSGLNVIVIAIAAVVVLSLIGCCCCDGDD